MKHLPLATQVFQTTCGMATLCLGQSHQSFGNFDKQAQLFVLLQVGFAWVFTSRTLSITLGSFEKSSHLSGIALAKSKRHTCREMQEPPERGANPKRNRMAVLCGVSMGRHILCTHPCLWQSVRLVLHPFEPHIFESWNLFDLSFLQSLLDSAVEGRPSK